MATEENPDGQCQVEKVVLKRKLTGPPRLLLGKSKPNHQADDRSEARAKRNKRVSINDGTQICSSPKCTNSKAGEMGSPVVTPENLDTTSQMGVEEAWPEQPTEPSRAHSISEGDETIDGQLEGHSKMRRLTKCSWKRFFSPSVICIRRSREDGSQGGVGIELPYAQTEIQTHTEAKSIGEDTISSTEKCVRDAPGVDKVKKSRGRFTIQTWPTFRRFLTASYIRQRPKKGHIVQEVSEDIQEPVTFKKKLQRFLTHGRRVPSPALPHRHEESQKSPGDKEVEVQLTVTQDKGYDQRAPTVQEVDLLEDGTEVRGQCTERVTVSAEVSALLIEENDATESASSPEVQGSPIPTAERQKIEKDTESCLTEESLLETESSIKTECDLTCTAGPDSTVLNEDVNVAMDTNKVHIDELDQVHSSEKEEPDSVIVSGIIRVFMDTNDYLPDSNQMSPENAAEYGSDEEIDVLCRTTEENILQTNDQPSTNIAADGLRVLHCSLCTVNTTSMTDSDVTEQDSLLLGNEGCGDDVPRKDCQDLVCGERLLVQTACSLVQAAMSAAMEQLIREQQGTPTNVHREAQGCRDHA